MSDANDIPLEAVEFLRKASDAESTDRSEQLEDLKFSLGDQWVQQMQNQRTIDHRPWFTLNETDTYIRQVSNQMRQQRPRIKAQGVNSSADAKIAEIITGITRHIEQISDADTAYDNAGESAARIGVGYWRISADYCSDESFDQEIKIEPIFNRFSVYFDPLSVLPDGSDAERALITDLVQKEDYQRMYPDADMTQFNARATGDSTSEWITKDTIRLAEFYKIEREKRKLVHLSDGSAWWDDEMPKADILAAVGVKVKGDRQSWRKKVCWYKVNAVEVLDERVLPGRYIPIIPVYGAQAIVDGRIRRFGIVRAAKDPQRLLNFMKTAVVETVALAPKAKHLVAYGSDTGFENEWDSANIASLTRLHYNSKGDDGEDLPPPIPIPPPPVPDGFLTVAENAHNDLQRVLGMFDPAMNAPGNQSGKALNSMQQQSDMSNYHLYDNLTRSIKHTGRIVLDWIPTYYNKRRVMRIIGDDGKPDMVTINDDQAVGKIENDLTVGEYDVVMETGPGYNSKREEGAEMIAAMVKADPQLMAQAGDLLFRNMDFPGADIIADRLAAANPLAQIDDKSDIPPRAQMMIKQLQQQVQGMQGQLQQAGMVMKFRGDIAAHQEAGQAHRMQIQEAGETERLRIKEENETQRRLMEDRSYAHEIHTKALTTLGAKEIEGVIKILTEHMKAGQSAQDHERAKEIIDIQHAAAMEQATAVNNTPED
jgi:hypothetical protein